MVALFSLALMGCETKYITRGHILDPELVASLEKGKDDRRKVAQSLGSPSTLPTFNDRVWYYVSEKLSKEGFLEPEVQSRNILVVVFDEKDLLTEIKNLDLSDGQGVEIVQRITPTEGQDLTILRQLLGNIGRFSMPGSDERSM